jgi:LmbE family N-acetylglucosaminyl deacetylase
MAALLPTPDLGRLLVVSPHFDDGVLGCGHLLDRATAAVVVTVFGGRPPRARRRVAAWDRRCGFTPDDDVVAARRAENAQALTELGVDARDLGLLDAQYRRRPCRAGAVESVLAPVVVGWRPTTIALPLGIGHSDHRIAADGALRVADAGGSELIAYGELPYALRAPDAVAQRLAHLRRRYDLVPWPFAARLPAVKAKAAAAYSSQLVALDLTDSLDAIAEQPEQLWIVRGRARHGARLRRGLGDALERRGVTRGRARVQTTRAPA